MKTPQEYSKGFINYLNKETGGLDKIDDPDLIDLIESDYEELTGKKARIK